MVNVVIGIIEKDERILLIKRERGDFVGLWGIPGGKVEECEHIDDAIKREMLEELGLNTEFKGVLGISTEIMHDKNSTSILSICLLSIKDNSFICNPEFQYKWFSKDELLYSNDIIKSDKDFIKTFYIDKSTNYLKMDCYRDNNGNYFWE